MKDIDILFIDGLEPRHLTYVPSFIGYLFPIAAYLEINGYSFKIFNLSTLKDYTNEGLIYELKKYNFKSIGMTSNVDNIRYVYSICDVLKKHFPVIPIIIGGSQASFSDSKILQESECDIIVRHEGEETLIELLEFYIDSKGTLERIKGISYKLNGKVLKNPDRPLLDINLLPTPQYGIATQQKYWIIPQKSDYQNFDDFLQKVAFTNRIFLSTRGCPYRCLFCVEGSLKNKVRKRCIANTVKDLIYFLEIFTPKYVFIGDDTFTSSRKRIIEICEQLILLRKKYDFVWYAEGRVNILAENLDMIPYMIDAGLYKLQIGVESGNQEILDFYNKKITIEQIKTVVSEFSKYDNVLLHGNFIIGNPRESKQSIAESINFAVELIRLSNFKIDISAGYLVPFEGTPLRKNPDKYEIELLHNNFEHSKNAFIDILCKPQNISLIDLQNAFPLFEFEISKYYKQNIWTLPKEKIDKKILFDHKYGGSGSGVISKGWAKTFYSLFSLQRYYILFRNNLSINSSSISSLHEMEILVPFLLWELNFSIQQNVFSFNSLSGSKIVINEPDNYFLEMATGKNSIKEILEYEESPIIYCENSVKYVFTFYKQLESQFALIFRKF